MRRSREVARRLGRDDAPSSSGRSPPVRGRSPWRLRLHHRAALEARSCDAHRERRLSRGARAGRREPGRSPRREPRDDGLRRPAGARRRPAPAAGRRGRQPSLRHDGRGRRPPRVARVRAAHRRRRWAGRAGPSAPVLRRPAGARRPRRDRAAGDRRGAGRGDLGARPSGRIGCGRARPRGLDRVLRIGLEAPA